MTQAEIRENIEKLKKAIASPATQDAFKPKLQEKLAEFQSKLEGAKEVEAQEKAISKLEDKTEKKIAKLNEVISSPKTSPKVKAAVSKGIAAAKKQVKEAKQEGRREISQKKKEVVQKAKAAKTAKATGAKRGRPKKAAPAPAKKVVKRKTKAVVKYEKALSSLDKLVNRTKELRERYKGQGVDLERDSKRSAKAFGWRLKGSNRRPTKAQIQSGAAYWEGRPNRADVYPKAEIKLAKGGVMAKGGINSSDDRWVVTFQNQDSGEFEKVFVEANNKKSAINIAEDESGFSSDWQYYSAKKEMAYGGMMKKGGWVKNSKGNYRKQTKAEIKNDVKFKAKKAGWKKSEATGDWYYEDRPNRTDKSRTLRYATGGMVASNKRLLMMIEDGFAFTIFTDYEKYSIDIRKNKKTNKIEYTIYNARDRKIKAFDSEKEAFDYLSKKAGRKVNMDSEYASGGFVKNSKGNYRKQTKAELAHDSRFKAKKAGWKQSEATGDWYYEDRPNRTDKSRKLKV